MEIGYNTNIPYKGRIYHAQTEDTGPESCVLISLLYYKGVILASRKSNYADLKGQPDLSGQVRERMKEQHKNIIKELINGRISLDHLVPDEAAAGAEGTAETPYRSLDDILIDYILTQAGKT